MLKKFKGLIIVLSIETIFYITESPVDLEMFFLFFGLIFAVLNFAAYIYVMPK